MKIAIVRKKYTPYGGAERSAAALVEGFLDKGHEVHIFAHQWKEGDGQAKRLYFHKVPIIPGPSFLEVLSFAMNSARMLKKGQFDLIHSFERTLYQDIYRAGDGCHKEWLLRREKVIGPFKQALASINPLHFSILAIERHIFKEGNYKLIIANSQKGMEEIIRHYNVPPEKIAVVYNGVDLERFHPGNRGLYREELRRSLGIARDELILLFVGSGFERKGLDFLLRALALVKKGCDQPFKLVVVVGKGREEKYARIARRMGLAQDVIFTGPTERVGEFYASADIFALPTLYDPFSNTCLEAMASGLPLITSRANGAAELLSEGAGLVVEDPMEWRKIAEALLYLNDPESRQEIGLRARQKAEAFSVQGHVQKTLDLYEKVLFGFNGLSPIEG